MSQTAADELQRRLVSFAVKIIELVVLLPKTPAGRHVSGQILRSRFRFASADKLALKIRLACILGASIRTAQANASQINK